MEGGEGKRRIISISYLILKREKGIRILKTKRKRNKRENCAGKGRIF